MAVTIRRTLLHVQTTHEEGGKTVDDPTLLVAALAIVRNPWFGRGWVEDTSADAHRHGPVGMRRSCGGLRQGVARGNGWRGRARPGTQGNQYRNAGQDVCVPQKIPLMDKDDGGRRSHYQTIHLQIPDAPADDEIIVSLGASVGGHPHHRIGDRYQDLEEMGHDPDNPAGV